MALASRFGRSLLALASTVLAGIVFTDAASAQAPRDVTIGLSSNSLGASGFRLAKELDLFEKHGLRARIIVMDTGSSVATALISGSVQVALAAMGELVAARTHGIPAVAATNTYGGMSGTLVLAQSVVDRLGVSATAPLDERLKALSGITVATTSGTSTTTISYREAAERAGVKFRSVYMAQDAMPAALASGAIQGFAAGSPFWSFPITRGQGVLWISGPKGDLPADLTSSSSNFVLVMRSFAEANPDLIRQIDAVYQDFVRALDERPAEVKAVIAKLYPTLDTATIDMLFDMESFAWKARPLTAADVAKDIGFLKKASVNLPGVDQLDPASMLWTIR